MIDELKQWEYDKGYDRGHEDAMTVLDKIRSEIEHLHEWAFSRVEVLRIIDKYKEGSEVKDADCD